MGALTPALGVITTGLGAVGTIASTVKAFDSSNQHLKQLQQRQRQDQAILAQDTALQREELAVKSAQDEETRRQALRRAVARQRASFGASGVRNQSGGSGEAVLLGLTQVTEDELKRKEELDNLRTRALDQNLTQNRMRNVLTATQTSERNNLRNLYGLVGA